MATRFDKAELFDLALVTLILGVFFSFRFPGKATFANWFGYFVPILILIAFSVFVHELAHHAMANKYLVKSRSRVWWFGVVFGLFLLLLTKGSIIFAAIWTVTMAPIYIYRPGRKTKESHAGPYEMAKIAIAGPLANLAIAIAAKAFFSSSDFAGPLMAINLWLAVGNLIPFFSPYFTLLMVGPARKLVTGPYTESEHIFFCSPPLFAFTFSFALIVAVLLYFLSALASIVIALVLAAAIFLAWHFVFEPEEGRQSGPSYKKF